MTDQMIQSTLDLPKEWINDTKIAHAETLERKIARGKGAPRKGKPFSLLSKLRDRVLVS